MSPNGQATAGKRYAAAEAKATAKAKAVAKLEAQTGQRQRWGSKAESRGGRGGRSGRGVARMGDKLSRQPGACRPQG